MNVIGPRLLPVVEIKRLTPDEIEVIKINLKANHEIPEIKYIPPKVNEEPQLPRGRTRSREKVQRWRSQSESTEKCHRWEHQLQIHGISGTYPDGPTTWNRSRSCTSSPTPSVGLDGDVSVKEEMDIEDHMIGVDDCASFGELLLEPDEKTECFVQSEYPCYKCDMVFPKSNLLLHHLKTHRTGQSFCSVFSRRRTTLLTKSTPLRRSASDCMDLLLSKKLNYRCEYCGRGFSRPNYLELHLRAFFRNRTCDKVVFPRKKYKTPSLVQNEQKKGSSLNSNFLGSDNIKNNPVEDQNFVRAMMMHVAATAEDCFNNSISELHKDKVGNNRQTGKETVDENLAPAICERSGSTVGNAQNIRKVNGRKEGANEARNVNGVLQNVSGIAANFGSQGMKMRGRVICNICSRRFKSSNHLNLHYRAHYKVLHNMLDKGNLMSTNTTNEVPPLLDDESVFPSACGKRYKDTYLLKKHEMTHKLEASGASNFSNIGSEDPVYKYVPGNSTRVKEQRLQSQNIERKNCSEVRVSTHPPSTSKQNVPSGDVPSNAEELDVSPGLPLGSSNATELPCFVSLEKLALVTKANVDVKSVVKSEYGNKSHVKKSAESENSVKRTMCSKVSNNKGGSSRVTYGKTRQTSQNISYSETGSNSRCSENLSSIVSSYKKKYRCRQCKRKVFMQREDYERHKILECYAHVTTCQLCGESFYKRTLRRHMSRHLKSWEGGNFILNPAVSGASSKRKNMRKSPTVFKSKTNRVLQHDVPSKKPSGKVVPHLNKKPLRLSSRKLDQKMSKHSG